MNGVSERYSTTKAVFVLKKSEKDNSYTQNNMVLDHMNTIRIEERINVYNYPEEDFQFDFSDANEDYSNGYQQFLQLGYKHKMLIVEQL